MISRIIFTFLGLRTCKDDSDIGAEGEVCGANGVLVEILEEN